MKKFDIPQHYKSSIITQLKELRKQNDPRKKDFSPSVLDFGPVQFLISRHFGFCFGVENAIEIAYKTLEENPGKKVFLLSEMIHNPQVNADLLKRGINFILDNYGKQLIEWSEINKEDIVIVPAFGTTLQTENLLKEKGIDLVRYNTTCPFVEKVWTRAENLGTENYSIIIHGKAIHEETRATFSHADAKTKAVIVLNIEEAQFLSKIILGEIAEEEFYKFFEGRHSPNFVVEKDLARIGIVNQTTMLASETQAIANRLRDAMIKKYGEEKIKDHFADTRDTLCYATNDNQSSALALLKEDADLAIVVGGYNSSNTTHLVELLEEKFPTYFVNDAEKIISSKVISHFDIHSRVEKTSKNFLPQNDPIKIAITCGASCPDSIVDGVLKKILSFYDVVREFEEVLAEVK